MKYYKFIPLIGLLLVLHHMNHDPNDKLQLEYGWTSTPIPLYFACIIQAVSVIGFFAILFSYLLNFLEH